MSSESPSTACTVPIAFWMWTSMALSPPVLLRPSRAATRPPTPPPAARRQGAGEADERQLVDALVGDLDRFDGDVVLRRVQLRPGVLERQSAAEVPDVARHHHLVEQRDHAVAPLAACP